MNEQRNNGRGIFYGVIGVATLVVAIIGATFAYFTATAGVNDAISGNMASVSLGLAVSKVTKVDEAKGGMIPMSNGMVEAAVTSDSICVDDNGNAVCQIYKIVLSNNSTAGVFVDGYVSLTGGSGTPTDYTSYTDSNVPTTMRWAQVFCEDQAEGTDKNLVTKCSTKGTQTLGTGTDEKVTFATALGNNNTDNTLANGASTSQILSTKDNIVGSTTISGNPYDTIKTNYIRVSDHKVSELDANNAQSYNRTNDLTSALVFSRNVAGKVGEGAAVTDTYYIVVWLAETGTNQTANSTGAGAATSNENFFSGNVSFISAQGSEVSATFTGYGRVPVTDDANQG